MRKTLVGLVVSCVVSFAAECWAQYPAYVQPAPVDVHVRRTHDGCLPRTYWTMTTDGYAERGKAGLAWEKRKIDVTTPYGTKRWKELYIFPFGTFTYDEETDIRYTLVPQPRSLPCPCH